jgi:hypothetical protein
MDFSRGQVNLNQLLRVDKGHLGQGKRIKTITLDRSSQISPQSRYLLHLRFHQPTIGMLGTQVDGYHQPRQAGRLEYNDRVGSISENTLFQLGQAFWRCLECESITDLCPVIQTTNPVATLV